MIYLFSTDFQTILSLCSILILSPMGERTQYTPISCPSVFTVLRPMWAFRKIKGNKLQPARRTVSKFEINFSTKMDIKQVTYTDQMKTSVHKFSLSINCIHTNISSKQFHAIIIDKEKLTILFILKFYFKNCI